MAEPALDLISLQNALHDALERAERAEHRAREAETSAAAATMHAEAAERRAQRAETHVHLAEARARKLMAISRRYRNLIAQLPDTDLVVFDQDLRYQIVEGQFFTRFVGRAEGQTPRELFRPQAAATLEGLYQRIMSGTHDDDQIDLDGRTYYIQGRPIRDENDRVTGGMVLSRDITRLKQAEAELLREREALQALVAQREVLLREVYHRVKNNLQVVNSLLSLQSRTIADPAARDALQACRHRVNAMARVHERLYQAPDVARIDLAAYLRDLTGEVDRSYRVGTGVMVALDLEPVESDLQHAIPIGLIAHELLANAFQHAFPSGREGTIRVVLKTEDGATTLTIADDGVGLQPSERKTLGTRLVSSLAAQLGATIQVESHDDRGTRTIIHLPGEPR